MFTAIRVRYGVAQGESEIGYGWVVCSIIVYMGGRLWLVIAAAALTISCARHWRTERLMMWSEEAQFAGMALPDGERNIVLRFVDDPEQGVEEEWNSDLWDRLTRLGNPVRVTFDCWRQFGGTFGFNIVAIGGEPYVISTSHAGSFSQGPTRPYLLESAVPR